jgi:hypothetical protein
MYKVVPAVIGLSVATFFVCYSSMQMDRASNIFKYGSAEPPGWARETTKKREEPTAEATPRWSSNNDRTEEPVSKVMIRLLNEVDDLLDTITDRASFEAVKPRILRRVRQVAELAKGRQNQGMTQFSKSAAKELEKAVNRHATSLVRADAAAPWVTEFFKNEVQPLLNPK